MLNEVELDLALEAYETANLSLTWSYQRWANAPGRERQRRLLIR